MTSDVKPFDRALVEATMQKRGWKWSPSGDGSVAVRLMDKDGDLGGSWWWRFYFDKEVLEVSVISDRKIQKLDWDVALVLCNDWNGRQRWPAANLQVANPRTDTEGFIRLAQSIWLRRGIHEELLED